MARSRLIKPAFFTNDDLAECPSLARLLFIGLWTIADKKGRIKYRPKKIKVELLPYDECNIEELLSNLEKFKFVSIYEVEGQNYLQINKFEKHQQPHHKESESVIPEMAVNKDKFKLGSSMDQACLELTSSLAQAKCLLTPLTLNPYTLTLNPYTLTLNPKACSKLEILHFSEFWEHYPRKRRGNKEKSLKAYKRALKEKRATEEQILTGLNLYRQSQEVANGYAKGAEAWLNADGWANDYSPPRSNSRANQDMQGKMNAAARAVQNMTKAGY